MRDWHNSTQATCRHLVNVLERKTDHTGLWLLVQDVTGRCFGIYPHELDWQRLTTDGQRADWINSAQAHGVTLDQHGAPARWLAGHDA